MTVPPVVSLIIPTYNRGDVLCDIIAMALDQTYPSYEVIVVDQTASIDCEVRSYLDSVGPRVRYLRLPRPNLPAARNAGVRAARGDIVVFVDDDVLIQRDYIALHARHYRTPSVGAVMGATLDSFTTSVENYAGKVRDHFGIDTEPIDGVAAVKWVIGGNTSYRRAAILEADLFDERFGGSGWSEDADLAVRVRHLGYTLLLDSRIKLVHLALTSGGCRNRDPAVASEKRREHFQLHVFFLIKNIGRLGVREVCTSLATTYRQFALNRKVMRRGPSELLRKHLMFVRFVARAFHWLIFSRAPRPAPAGAVGSTLAEARHGYEL